MSFFQSITSSVGKQFTQPPEQSPQTLGDGQKAAVATKSADNRSLGSTLFNASMKKTTQGASSVPLVKQVTQLEKLTETESVAKTGHISTGSKKVGNTIKRTLLQTAPTSFNQVPETSAPLKSVPRKAKLNTKNSLTTNTDHFLKTKITEIQAELCEQKKNCEEGLLELNGHFFQDPKSQLKQAWDKAVTEVNSTLGMTINTRGDLDVAEKKIKDMASVSEPIAKAQGNIQEYLDLEQKRDALEGQLHNIISIEKTNPNENLNKSLEEQVDALKDRQRQLCGMYYQDPSSLLDLMWKKYQGERSPEGAAASLNTYNGLEEERKSNEAKLFELQSQIALEKSGKDMESLAIEKIAKQQRKNGIE